jgi:uncharacterized protein (UPF0264 family)
MTSTRLLVSVRNAQEASDAWTGGAEIIDIKEPVRGPLGLADPVTLKEIRATLPAQVPLSAALGELHELDVVPSLAGLRWAKIGLMHQQHKDWEPSWKRFAEQIGPVRLLGVCYADHGRVQAPDFTAVLRCVAACQSLSPEPAGILVDTAVKDGQGLLQWMSIAELRGCAQQCRNDGLFLALAGALQREDIVTLKEVIQPDIIAVRGAACRGNDRLARIDREAVRSLRQSLWEGAST